MTRDNSVLDNVLCEIKDTLQGKGKLERSMEDQNVGSSERVISAATGAFITTLGLKHLGSFTGKLLTLVGGTLLYRGLSGYCPVSDAMGRDTSGNDNEFLHIEETITVNRPRAEVFAYWRKLSNLPQFMSHLESVVEIGDTKSHWVARAPKGLAHIEWDAEITHEEQDKAIAWRSVEGSDVYNDGEVDFVEAPGGGTHINVRLKYQPPAGVIGEKIAGLLNPMFEQTVKKDIRELKQVLETGMSPVAESAIGSKPTVGRTV